MASPKNDRKRQRSEVDNGDTTIPDSPETISAKQTKRARVEEKRSLFVRSLPPNATNETLAEYFSQHFPVKHAVVVRDHKTKESRGYGFVTFADAEDATEAQKTLDKSQWDGRCLRVDVAEPRHRKGEKGAVEAPMKKPGKPEFEKPPKLIVRNLPWTIKTSEQLSHLFRSFGKVKFADLPSSQGKLKGFGFVTIRGKKNAEKALEAINGKEIDGRTLAVDWAVDKETWERQTNAEKDDAAVVDEDEKPADKDEAPSPIDPALKTAAQKELDDDLQNFLKNHFQNLEEEDDDDDDDDKDDEEDDDAESKDKITEVKHPKTTDNSSTLFIRNLPFTTTDEQLKSFFASFGPVRYARVVVDKITDKPAGTGFVCFFKESDAKACIKDAPRPKPMTAGAKQSLLVDENADPSGKYTMDGRLLQVAQAVNKQEASTLAESSLSKRREKDKRRLYLLSEGAISRGTPLFDMLSATELGMRQASAVQRKKLIQSNPSLHLSLTRLAIRNIPRHIGSKELKELARKAIVGFAKDVKEGRRQPLSKEENARDDKEVKEKERQRKQKGKGIVRQAKIVFESNQGSKVPEQSGAGKSRGYGFIEYTSHHWALMGLRYLNGYELEGDNGRKQRLIVEFAIENAQVVQRRRAMEEKSAQTAQAKQAEGQANEDSDDEEGEAEESKPVARKDKKGKDRKVKNRKGKGPDKDESDLEDEEDKTSSKKEDMKQKLIARKRLMRKKKATVRGKR